jgi:hypothetical protein
MEFQCRVIVQRGYLLRRLACGKHSAPSRTPFRSATKTVRLPTGIAFTFRAGMLFGITTEWCSASDRNRVHLRPDSPLFSKLAKRPAIRAAPQLFSWGLAPIDFCKVPYPKSGSIWAGVLFVIRTQARRPHPCGLRKNRSCARWRFPNPFAGVTRTRSRKEREVEEPSRKAIAKGAGTPS